MTEIDITDRQKVARDYLASTDWVAAKLAEAQAGIILEDVMTDHADIFIRRAEERAKLEKELGQNFSIPLSQDSLDRAKMMQYLKDTDYIIIKIYEASIGLGNKETKDLIAQYQDVINERITYRTILGGKQAF